MITSLSYTEQRLKEIKACLSLLRELVNQPDEEDREELIQGTLWRLASEITGTVLARPRLPLSSAQAWSEARRLVLTEADDLALYLRQSEKNELRTLLSESYA
jgi:hypothetical protein